MASRRVFATNQLLTDPRTVPRIDATVHDIAGWRRAVMWPFALLVRLWGMTLRFEVPPEDLRNYTKKDVPVAMALWHNRLFLASEIYRRYRKPRPLYALVSASRDGAWLVSFFEMVGGMRAVRGSSSRLGRQAAGALVEVLRQGHDIGITPDGPRGPRCEVKPGALTVARLTKTPLLLIGADFESAWRLHSWDRFVLPRPFSRVRLRCELVPAEELADRAAATAQLQTRLLALNPDPDATPGRDRSQSPA